MEESKNNLEKLVTEKTNNVSNLVENLEQGFMIVDKNGKIQKGATKASLNIFGVDPADQLMEEVLQLDKNEKENFNKWLTHIFSGIVPFKDLLYLARKDLKKSRGRLSPSITDLFIKIKNYIKSFVLRLMSLKKCVLRKKLF